jgi:hypothetical protein
MILLKNIIGISAVILLILLIHSCKRDPTIITTEITNITATSANSGGNITDDGSQDIGMYGICWSTSQNPTNLDPTKKTIDGTGPKMGIFTSTLRELSGNTTYYVRAYVMYWEKSGIFSYKDFTVYGNQITFMTLQSKRK